MTLMPLEYIVGQLTESGQSYAIKSHKNRNQNPCVDIQVRSNDVIWKLCGLAGGTVESSEGDVPAATRLDFYVGKQELLTNRSSLPTPTVSASGEHLPLTNPTGTEHQGGKTILWEGTISKHRSSSARMVLPDGPYKAWATNPSLNIDYERAPYPLTGGGILQVHFGVQGEWALRTDGRVRVARADILMGHEAYSDVYQVLYAIH